MANSPGTSWRLALAVAIAAAMLPRCDPASPPLDGALLTQPPVPDRSGLQPPLARMIEEAARVVELNPDDAAVWGKLGSIYVVHDFTAEAVECLEQAAQRDPGEFRWSYLVGKAVMLDDHAASLSAFRRARALRDDYAPLEALIGRALLRQGDLDDAEAAFRRALALNDTLARGHLGLGQIALERGDAAAAVTALERARELGVGSQEVHWALAIAHRRHGDAAAAARAETAAASATVSDELLPDPVYQELIATLGVTLARRNLRVTRYLERGNAKAALFRWSYLVGKAVMLDDHAASLSAFRRARALRDDYAPLEALIGRALLRQGDLDDAEAAFRRALALNDTLARGHLGLGQIALERGDAAAAVTALERARELGGWGKPRGPLGARDRPSPPRRRGRRRPGRDGRRERDGERRAAAGSGLSRTDRHARRHPGSTQPPGHPLPRARQRQGGARRSGRPPSAPIRSGPTR